MARAKEITSFEELTWKAQRDAETNERFAKKNNKQHHKPLTDKHKKYVENIKNNDITMVVGPAGSLKTYLACQVASDLLLAGKIDTIVLCRPLITCEEELGILPGDLLEKVSPYNAALIQCLKENLGEAKYEKFSKEEKIVIEPLAIMRGKTFHNAFVILDEGQNATFSQLKMFLSRIGHNSKMVVNGDIEQSDLKIGLPPLIDVWRRLSYGKKEYNIAFSVFTEEEVFRSPIVRFITKRLGAGYDDHLKTKPVETKEKESVEKNNLKFYKRDVK